MTKISNQYSLTNILTADLANSRLGINNVSPTVALDVTGAGKFSSSVTSSFGSSGANFNSNAATTGSVNAYRVSNTTGTGSFGIDNSTGGDLITGGLAYATILQSISNTALQLGTNQTARLTINPSGNVGIGTTSPSAKLEVNGFGTANSIMTYVCAKFYGFGTGGLNIGTDGTNAQIATDSSGVDLTFLTRVSGVFSERMRITSGGSLLIQTTTGVSGFSTTINQLPSSSGGQLALNNKSGGAYAEMGFYNDGTYKAQIYWQNSNSNFYIQNGAGGVYMATNATAFTANSDERLKNINYIIENATEKLMTLRAVNFSWKSDSTNKENFGLIAQDVEKVLPQVIDKSTLGKNNSNNTEYLGVRYQELVPVLVKAIQELSAKVSLLENK